MKYSKKTTLFSSVLLSGLLFSPQILQAEEMTQDTQQIEPSEQLETSESAEHSVEDNQITESSIAQTDNEVTNDTKQEDNTTTIDNSLPVEDPTNSKETAINTTAPSEETLPDFPKLVMNRSLFNNNAQSFIASIASQAQAVSSENDLYASVMIAQAALESGYGSSTLSQAPHYNLFGIKGNYNGQSVTMLTWEDDGFGNTYWIEAAFRKYPSYAESFADNAYVLKNTSFTPGVYYYSGAWKSNTNSYKDATTWLTGRYATDTGYAAKLNNLIDSYNLTQYDTPSP